jgi:hypothetical protein
VLEGFGAEPPGDRWTTARAEEVRRWSLLGWILPSLLASCAKASPDQVQHIATSLEKWVGLACKGLHLGAESCLAQGFKYEANRLPHRSPPETRDVLIGHVRSLLEATKWWYSQISLLQALALWSLDGPAEEFGRWTGTQHHPYVRATAKLCAEATKPAHRPDGTAPTPGHFIWIDETGIAAKVGSRSATPDVDASEGLWISPAAGWHTLKEPARQLVGDLLIFLNLVEADVEPAASSRPATPDDRVRTREGRRRRVRDRGAFLPPCMIKSGHGGLLAAEDPAAEGDDDSTVCGCCLKLCPYPGPEERPFRGELGETFCREQRRLLGARGLLGLRNGGVPPWHERSWKPGNRRRTTIGRFWRSMEERARDLNARSLSPDL